MKVATSMLLKMLHRTGMTFSCSSLGKEAFPVPYNHFINALYCHRGYSGQEQRSLRVTRLAVRHKLDQNRKMVIGFSVLNCTLTAKTAITKKCVQI